MARFFNGSTTASIDHPPTNANVNDFTPSARLVRVVPKLSGTLIPDHFFTESAREPMAGAASLKVPAPRPPKVKASTPAARAIKLDPKLSGTVTPDHFCTDSAITPTPGAAVDKALAPAPPNVNPCIPDDRIPS